MISVCNVWFPGNEKKYVEEAIGSSWISGNGPFNKKFEDKFADYLGMKFGVSCINGTAALHMACMALGITRGDEVIMPALTNIATANAIILCGAKPVLVDSESETWNIDVNKIKEKITKKTKAIMPVHIYGHPCDMDPIIKLAKENNLFVIEDAAEAHGAEYKGRKCGTMSDISCFSFFANKIITTGEGGMCLTNNERLAEKLRKIRNLAFGEPRFVHHEIGFNYRMPNIQAAIGLAQMENVEMLVNARRNVGLMYNKKLEKLKEFLQLPVEKDYAKNVYWMYGVVLKDNVSLSKEEVMEKLYNFGIETRSFFIPMNEQPAFLNKVLENVPDCSGDYKIAKKLGKRGFYLPSSSNITEKEIDYVCECLEKILKGKN